MNDLTLIRRIEDIETSHSFPTGIIPRGDKTSALHAIGITHSHYLYTPRNLLGLAELWSQIQVTNNPLLVFCFTGSLRAGTLLTSIKFNYYFHGGGGPITPGIKGTYYVPSFVPEIPVTKSFESRISAISHSLGELPRRSQTGIGIATQSATECPLQSDSADYVFVDPPFGSNLMYSELNFLWEAWLGVLTNIASEVVINQTQQKGLSEYQRLMERCFHEFYRILKPGRWMTVEFHNSQNRVWNAIQEALLRAGFVVADVRTFDKRQGTFR